jgi:adenylosuccinate lyase
MMNLNPINLISPVDGRYHQATSSLSGYFSESALIRYRVLVEIEYFIALCEIPLAQLKNFDKSFYEPLRDIYRNFTLEDSLSVKETEKTTNHDVKAVEYFIKEKFDKLKLQDFKEFIHFGLTSQDINNTAIPLSLADALKNINLPILEDLIRKLKSHAEDWKDIAMLAKTHGQPASPTRLGKELMVFVERLEVQAEQLKQVPFSCKFGGATGNFNAHHIAYPDVNWIDFANQFTSSLGIKRSQFTTQIEHYDNIGALCDALKRICTIIIDLDRDFWMYVSMDYFKQKIKEGEVGSSAMPHKVNPIDFENSEGNLGIAIALFEHFAVKLPVSRLQRDLTDSTVLRNIGVPLAHMLIAVKATLKGLDKLILNQAAIDADLDNNWAVVAEAIQTVLRREGYPKPYEALKELTRKNEKINRDSLHQFIETLDIDEDIKHYLKKISPFNYTGVVPE